MQQSTNLTAQHTVVHISPGAVADIPHVIQSFSESLGDLQDLLSEERLQEAAGRAEQLTALALSHGFHVAAELAEHLELAAKHNALEEARRAHHHLKVFVDRIQVIADQ